MLGVDGPVWTLIGRAKNYSIHGEFTGEYLDRRMTRLGLSPKPAISTSLCH